MFTRLSGCVQTAFVSIAAQDAVIKPFTCQDAVWGLTAHRCDPIAPQSLYFSVRLPLKTLHACEDKSAICSLGVVWKAAIFSINSPRSLVSYKWGVWDCELIICCSSPALQTPVSLADLNDRFFCLKIPFKVHREGVSYTACNQCRSVGVRYQLKPTFFSPLEIKQGQNNNMT